MSRSALLLAVALAAACAEPSRPPPALDERHVVTVDGTAVRYNGKPLDWTADAKRWEDVLGPASREVRGISVWDDLGVLVYHNHGTPQPNAFVVVLGLTAPSDLAEAEPEFWPRKAFGGRLVVDGALVHAGSTVAEIDRQKKGPAFRRGYLPTLFSYDLDGYYVRLDVGRDGTPMSVGIALATGEKPRDVRRVEEKK